MKKNPIRVADLLEAAAQRIDEHGWWDGHGPAGDRNCLVTSLHSAHGQWRIEAMLALRESLGRRSLTGYNDSHTQEDVTTLLRATATRLRLRAGQIHGE